MASTNGKPNGRVRSEDKARVSDRRRRQLRQLALQGVEYYKYADPETPGPASACRPRRLPRPRRRVPTAAFDVTQDKVGKDLADAIWAHPNDTYRSPTS